MNFVVVSLVWLLPLAMAGALGWFIFRVFKPAKGRAMVCAQCEHHGPTVLRTKGSTGVELLLWLCFLVPGLIYSVWRLSTRGQVCASCGSADLVPATSPAGRRMIGQSTAAGQGLAEPFPR